MPLRVIISEIIIATAKLALRRGIFIFWGGIIMALVAQDVLNRLGMDMSTAINIYLAQIVEEGGIPTNFTLKKQRAPRFGGWEGKIWMSDDFDAPMEEFKEYML